MKLKLHQHGMGIPAVERLTKSRSTMLMICWFFLIFPLGDVVHMNLFAFVRSERRRLKLNEKIVTTLHNIDACHVDVCGSCVRAFYGTAT